MSARVLVVDDEQSLAKVVASYLERDGHEVTCVFDGPAAVDAARRDPRDVVVLDPGGRLFAAQTLVVLVGGVTLGLVTGVAAAARETGG